MKRTGNGFPGSSGHIRKILLQGQFLNFNRTLSLDFMTGAVNIKGKMGDMEETGTARMIPCGGLLIDRQIGPYHVQQKVTFGLKDGDKKQA